jgi:hypothetical protein
MQREREREKKRGDIERITVERNTTQNTPTGKRERKKKRDPTRESRFNSRERESEHTKI